MDHFLFRHNVEQGYIIRVFREPKEVHPRDKNDIRWIEKEKRTSRFNLLFRRIYEVIINISR